MKTPRWLRFRRTFCFLGVVLTLALSLGNASADWLFWEGGTSNDWDTGSNWNEGIVPRSTSAGNYDVVWFANSSPNMQLTLSQSFNNPAQVYFETNGNGYSIGSVGDSNGLLFGNWNGGGFYEMGNLVGSGEGETVNVPIETTSNFYASNFSPTNQVTGVNGIAGFDNPLTFNGPITLDNSGSNILVYGVGNVNFNGDIIGAGGSPSFISDSEATVTLAGTNSYTGNTQVGGTLVLDYTTNNTNKIETGATLIIGNNGNGGNVVVNGNASEDTTQSTAATAIRDSGSITVNGSMDPSGPTTTLNLGNIFGQGGYSVGATIDYTANGNAVITTTNAPPGQGTIWGQGATADKMYWAQPTATSTPGVYTITPLLVDDGDTFNNQWGNYTVDAGGQVLDPNGNSIDTNGNSYVGEGSNTVRFAAGGTLDLGGGTLYDTNAAVLVASDVSDNTAITNGTLRAFDFINYGTGVLTIDANLSGYGAIVKNGSGELDLGGDNSYVTNYTVVINSGKVVMDSANALGAENNLIMGDATATLDLNGNNLTVSSLNSNGDYAPGNQAAAAGLNSNIMNSAAGTLSRITIQGNGNNSDGGVQPTNLYGDTNLGFYYGGLNEVNGSIISLDVEKGADSSQVQFVLGGANPIGDQSGANSFTVTGVNAATAQFTGALVVGAGANLGLTGYGNVSTLGVFELNGNFSVYGEQGGNLAATYLYGTGAFVPGPSSSGDGVEINHVGSVADTFNGFLGTASNNSNMSLTLGGTGTLAVANPMDLIYGVYTLGTSKLITPGETNGGGFIVEDESHVTLTANSGVIAGNITLFNNAQLTIAPAGSGADVVVSSVSSTLQYSQDATLVLDAGQNHSLTFQMGNTSSSFNFWENWDDRNAITIGAAQGIAAMGTTDKFIILSNGTVTSYPGNNGLYNSFVGVSAFLQDDSVGSTKAATFMSYVGNGSASDTGFVAYNFGADTDNLNNGSATGLEKIDTDYTLTTNVNLSGLEVDNATLTADAGLNFSASNGKSSIILNGGSILGAGISTYQIVNIYTSLAGGTISLLNQDFGASWIEKDGPGVLNLEQLGGISGITTINDGALNMGNAVQNPNGMIVLNGGVLEGTTGTSGIFNRVLQQTQGSSDIVWADGGFAAVGGELLVDIQQNTMDLAGNPIQSDAPPLVWGATANFLGNGSVMQFGALNASGFVRLDNNIDLGSQQGGTAIYSRTIDVTANANDTGDPTAFIDYAEIDGVISGTSSYEGLSKDGTGTLYLAGFNSYTGATTIADGALIIYQDSNLGTAPTAAYALNSTPGITGNALTPGAILINGGATFGAASRSAGGGSDVVLSADRQILLASGTMGETPSIINVVGDNARGYTELDFGGIMADYVNEVGSLQKQGGGTFDYSGTAYNTGSDSVVGGTFAVVGAGTINSVSNVVIDNATPAANAKFNYASTAVGLTRTVTFGTGGGTFAYNSALAYTGATAMTIGAKQTASGGVGGAGNLGGTALTIANGGTLLPGDVDVPTGTALPGTLTVGAVTLQAGGNYNFLLVNATGAAGTGYGTVVTGSVDLTGLSSATPFDINIETLFPGFFTDAPGAPVNFDPLQNYTFTLFSTGVGGITMLSQEQLDADFAIFTTPNNGATGFDPVDGTWFVVEAADGSSLSLRFVPEPSTWVLLIGGVGMLFILGRARRRLVGAESACA